jgi:hypothetical protein
MPIHVSQSSSVGLLHVNVLPSTLPSFADMYITNVHKSARLKSLTIVSTYEYILSPGEMTQIHRAAVIQL